MSLHSSGHHGAHDGVLGVELGLPVPQVVQLHALQALQVGVAVGCVGGEEGKGPRTLMPRKGVHAVWAVEVFACTAG